MSADLLRRAAAAVEQLAAGATPEPWVWTWREDWGCGEWHTVTSSATDFDVATGGYEGGGVEREEDAKWITTLGPQVAAPLAAWLRAEAQIAEAIDRRPDPIAEMVGLDQDQLRPYSGPALDFARAVLDEPAEATS